MHQPHLPRVMSGRLSGQGLSAQQAAVVRLALFIGLGLFAAAIGARTARAEGPPEQVRMNLDRYEGLLAKLRPASDGASFGRASVQITPPDAETGLVQVSVSAALRAAAGGVVAVLPGDVVLGEARLDGSPLTVVRRDGAIAIVLPEGSRGGNLSIDYSVNVLQTGGGRGAVVPLPPVPSSDVVVNRGGPVRIWPAATVTSDGGSTRASLSAAAAVAIEWGASGAGRIFRAEHVLVVSADVLIAVIASKFEVVTTQSETWVRLYPVTTALVEVKDGDKALVTRVEGGWHEAQVLGTGRHTLAASIRTPVDRADGQPKVVVPLDEVPIVRLEVRVPGKHAIEVVDVPLETSVTGAEGQELTTSIGWVPPQESVTVTWAESHAEPEQAVRVSAETFQIVTLSEGVMRTRVSVRYQILQGKVREFALSIPDDAVPFKVEGEGIEGWEPFARTDSAPRQVRVKLGTEQEGSYALTIELEVVAPKTEGAPLPIPVVRPLGAFRETGVIALLDGDKVGFSPAVQTGYTAVGQDALPPDIRQALDRTVTQAFQHIGEPGAIKATVTSVKAREILYDARAQTLYGLKEGAVVAASTIQVEVKSGKLERLLLTFPSDATILNVIAPSLAKKGEFTGEGVPAGRKGYELRFAQALDGLIEVVLEFEVVPKSKGDALKLPDVRVVGAEVEAGSFGITAETGIEVTPATATELRRVDVQELPAAVRKRTVGGAEILLGYTFAHAPWSLELAVKRHETVETLTAQVGAAWIETTVYDDGQVATRAVYDMRNEDRQFVRIIMPEGAKVWTVALDGRPVKAVSDEHGALAVPLAKGKRALLELVYQARAPEALGVFGRLDLSVPKLDVLVTDLQWLVAVPRHLASRGFDTTLTESGTSWLRSPPASDASLPSSLPPAGDLVTVLLTRPVTDPSEGIVTVGFKYVVRPPDWVRSAAGTVAIVLLVIAAFGAARRRKMAGSSLVFAIVGLVVGVVWGLLGDVSEGPLGGALAAVLVAAFVGWLLRRDNLPTGGAL